MASAWARSPSAMRTASSSRLPAKCLYSDGVRMPRARATRPSVSASRPSRRRTSVAASTTSCWRVVSSSVGTLEPLGRPQAVAGDPVDGDVGGPGNAGDQPAGAEPGREREGGQGQGGPDAVHGVVDGDAARVDLAGRKARAGAGEEREVGSDEGGDGDEGDGHGGLLRETRLMALARIG